MRPTLALALLLRYNARAGEILIHVAHIDMSIEKVDSEDDEAERRSISDTDLNPDPLFGGQRRGGLEESPTGSQLRSVSFRVGVRDTGPPVDPKHGPNNDPNNDPTSKARTSGTRWRWPHREQAAERSQEEGPM